MGGSSGLSSVLRVQLEVAEIENNIESLLSEIEAEKLNSTHFECPTSIDVVVPDSIIKVPFLLMR